MVEEQIGNSNRTQCHRRWKEAIEDSSNQQFPEAVSEGTRQSRYKAKQRGEEINWAASVFIC